MKSILPALLLAAIIFMAACQSDQEIEFRRYYTSGKIIYQNRCQNCHGADGVGLGTLIPPLTDTAFIKHNKSNLACIAYNGLAQTIIVNHKVYTQKMPPQGLAPVEIAEVITYITNSFGNKQHTYNTEQANKDLALCK